METPALKMDVTNEATNDTPNISTSIINDGLSLLSSYGWFIVFIVIAVCVGYVEFHPKWQRWRQKLEDQRKDAELKKNPEKALAIIEAREMAIQRMQQSYNSDVEKYNEKMAKKEREKREQILAEVNNRPQVLGNEPRQQAQASSQSTKSCSKPRLRNNDYNPLSGGGGGGGGYRPRRSGPSGG